MSRYAYPEGCFHIEPTPSQPQVAHCHGFFVPHDKRGRGYAHALKQKQMAELSLLGYDYATCTIDRKNKAQMCVLLRAGWAWLSEFNNTKTGGITQIWGCAIIKEKS